MDCQQVEPEEIVERYLTRRLSPDAQQEFEEHYFQCSRCFEEVQTLRAARAELAANQKTVRAEAPEKELVAGKWLWAAGVAAAAVIVIVLWLRPSTPVPLAPSVTVAPPAIAAPPVPSSPSLAELARVEPPAYTPAVLRGTADQARRKFREAMQDYTKRDYPAAIAGLREAVKLNPQAADANFFLATCYLLTNQTDEAITGLRHTIALGDTPLLEEAHFYLAKAFLHQEEPKLAAEELKKTIRLEGDLELKARELLRQLELVDRQSP